MMRWLPENVSTFGGDIDGLFHLIQTILLPWFIVTQAFIVYCAIRFRRREGQKAAYLPGNTGKQLAVIFLPLIVVVGLDLMIDVRGAEVWAAVKVDQPAPDVNVRVTAKQFNWNVTYPGPDGEFDTDDDVTKENALHVPIDSVVHVSLRAEDVLHSFFVPELRLKQDAVPGLAIDVWFNAMKPGTFELVCAELCGFGHSGMKGFLTVHPGPEYEAWKRETWPTS